MDNVTTLVPRDHWSFDIWQVRDGYRAECYRNGHLLWEYSSESVAKLMTIVNNTIGHIDDSH